MATIRPATPNDVPDMVRLLGQLFSQEAEFTPDARKQAEGLRALLDDGRAGFLLVAEEDGAAVGMMNLLYVVSTALGGRVAILEDMVVDEACRRRGIGSALMTAAIEKARADGTLRITLSSDAHNEAAHRFYQRFGFTRSTMVPFRLMLSRTLAA